MFFLLQTVQASKDDIGTATQILQKSREILFDSTDYAKELALVASELALAQEQYLLAAKCLQTAGEAHELRGYLDQARMLYSEALEISLARSPDLSLELYQQIGYAYQLEGNRGRAMEQYLHGLQLSRSTERLNAQSKILNSIGQLHVDQGAYEKALPIYEKALTINKKLDLEIAIADNLRNIGVVYRHLGDQDLSLKAFYEALTHFGEHLVSPEAFETKLLMAETLFDVSRLAKAELLADELLAGHDITPSYRSRSLLLKARCLLQTGRKREAQDHLNEGFALIENTNRETEKVAFLEAFEFLSRDLGQFEKAYGYNVRKQAVIDTINQLQRLAIEKEMATKFAVQEKEANLLVAQEKSVRAKQERNWLRLLLVVCAFSLILALRFLHFTKKSNLTLSEKNQLIRRNLREKEHLLREIHHRVKNNLQVVSSMLNMQARTTDDHESAQAIEKGRNRVKGMALIHQNLYDSQNLSGIDTHQYINRLCQSLLTSLDNQHKISLKTEVESMTMDIDTIIPIGLILNELITNAVMYAFTDKSSKGEITISFNRKGEEVELMVCDNGSGIDANKLNFKKTMGFRLIDAFVKKMKGSFQITNEEGTKVQLLFSTPHHNMLTA